MTRLVVEDLRRRFADRDVLTHDPDVVARTGRTLHMRDGKLRERA